MKRSLFRRWVLVALLAPGAAACGTTRPALFAMDIGGATHEVSATDASAGDLLRFPPGIQYNDVAATAADPGAIYAVGLQQGSAARSLTRLDVVTGVATVIPMVDNTPFRLPSQRGWWGVTFDPNDPDTGYMGLTASFQSGGQSHHIARFSLSNRSFEATALTTHRWSSLTMNDAGELLGAVDFFDASRSGNTTEVYTIDPDTGATTLRFTTSYRDVTGIDFSPADGRLYAINAFSSDDLVVLDPTTGAQVERIGDLPTGGPNGLAFTSIPVEPGDYNGDGRVDATDYDVWRESYGATGAELAADGNGDGVVDASDYTLWRDNATEATPTEPARTIPEPGAGSLLIAACLAASGPGKRG